MEAFFVELKENVEAIVFIHDFEEEYFLHYDTWNAIPQSYWVKKNDYFVDILVKKDINQRKQNCRFGASSYFGESRK